MKTFENAKRFICRNARPLDFVRWQFHFENGSAENVLKVLGAYQNPDGGFGHALEADCFNPNSSPIQTWSATTLLSEIGLSDSSHPIIQGILKYLESGADFDLANNQWFNCVSSNNDYPHAVWWTYKEGEVPFQYNPTASLAGFIIRFAEKNSALYNKGCEIAKQALEFFAESVPFGEQHVTGCFLELYNYCLDANADFLDMELFKQKLVEQIKANVCADTQKWNNEYVCLPSELIHSKYSLCYEDFAELIKLECERMISAQLPDGSYDVPWEWWTEYKEFTLAQNWWKGTITVNNMLVLKNFGGL